MGGQTGSRCLVGSLFVLVACGSPQARSPEQPAVGINMAERYPGKLGPELRRRWFAGELHVREVGQFDMRGTPDEHTTVLIDALGGHLMLGRLQLPNEALPFLVPQHWLDSIEIAPGTVPLPWTQANTSAATPVDLAALPPEVRAKLDPEVTMRLTDGAHAYTFSGTLAIAGCLDDARRAELLAIGFDIGYSNPDASCQHVRISFIAPVVVAPLAAALPWVIRIEAEPRAEPDTAHT